MVNVYECAQLALDVYSIHPQAYCKSSIISVDTDISKLEHGWYRCLVDESMNPSNHLYLQLYLKIQLGSVVEAVLAIRGTDNFDNAKQDIKTWFNDVAGSAKNDNYPSEYMTSVIAFYQKSKAFLIDVASQLAHRITFTAHSLGGALAKLMVAQYDAYKAAVFNAPGVASLVASPHRTSAIYAINSEHGFINKVGAYLPNIRLAVVDVPQYDIEAKRMIEEFMQNGKDEFNQGAQEYAKGGLWPSTKGVFEEFDALSVSSQAFESNAAYRQQEQQCYDMARMSMEQIGLGRCLLDLELQEYTAVISAQHSMKNMLDTLSRQRYHNLAATII